MLSAIPRVTYNPEVNDQAKVSMPIPDIPVPLPWLPGDIEDRDESGEGKDNWETAHTLVERYDYDMCRTWKDELEKLLLSAGLFSAAITAFAVESFKWLDNPIGPRDQILAFILIEVSNRTATPPPLTFTPSNSARRINVFFFLSLILSFTTVLAAILCLQWLREYQRDWENSYREALALRQIRYRGLIGWRVPEIIATLPVLLQCAIMLFFVGVIDLLWERDQLIAIIVLIPTCLTIILLVGTTVAPGLQQLFLTLFTTNDPGPQCPYKSPQARFFERAMRLSYTIFRSLVDLVKFCTNGQSHVGRTPSIRQEVSLAIKRSTRSWARFEQKWRVVHPQNGDLNLAECFQWMRRHVAQSVQGLYAIYECFSELDLPTQRTIVSATRNERAIRRVFDILNEDAYPNSVFSILRGDEENRQFKIQRQQELSQLFFLYFEGNGLPRLVTKALEHWIRVLHSFPRRLNYLLEIHPLSDLRELIGGIDDEIERDLAIKQLLLYAINWTHYQEVEIQAVQEMSDTMHQVLKWESEKTWGDSTRIRVYVIVFARLNEWLMKKGTADITADPVLFECLTFLHELISALPTHREKFLEVCVASCAYAFCKCIGGVKNLSDALVQLRIPSTNGAMPWKQLLKLDGDTLPETASDLWFWNLLPNLCKGVTEIGPSPSIATPGSPADMPHGSSVGKGNPNAFKQAGLGEDYFGFVAASYNSQGNISPTDRRSSLSPPIPGYQFSPSISNTQLPVVWGIHKDGAVYDPASNPSTPSAISYPYGPITPPQPMVPQFPLTTNNSLRRSHRREMSLGMERSTLQSQSQSQGRQISRGETFYGSKIQTLYHYQMPIPSPSEEFPPGFVRRASIGSGGHVQQQQRHIDLGLVQQVLTTTTPDEVIDKTAMSGFVAAPSQPLGSPPAASVADPPVVSGGHPIVIQFGEGRKPHVAPRPLERPGAPTNIELPMLTLISAAPFEESDDPGDPSCSLESQKGVSGNDVS